MTDIKSTLTSLEKRLKSRLEDRIPESGKVAYSKMQAKKRQTGDSKNSKSSEETEIKSRDPDIVKLTKRLDDIESTMASTDVVDSEVRGIKVQIDELEADLKARSLKGLTEGMINNDSREQGKTGC